MTAGTSGTSGTAAAFSERDAAADEAGDPLFGSGIHWKAGWTRHDGEITQVSLFQVIRQLPRQIRACLGLAWRADPRAVLSVLIFQSATGIATAFGLPATNSVLLNLFAQGPSPARVRAAIPSLIEGAENAAGSGGGGAP